MGLKHVIGMGIKWGSCLEAGGLRAAVDGLDLRTLRILEIVKVYPKLRLLEVREFLCKSATDQSET